MPRAAYLIPGRGGLWAGWRRDVRRFRRRRFRRRFRRFRLRSPGWVAAVGRATPPRPTRDNIDRLLGWLTSQPAGWLAGQPAEGPAFSRPYHHQYHHHSHDCQVTHHQQHKYHKLHPYLQHE